MFVQADHQKHCIEKEELVTRVNHGQLQWSGQSPKSRAPVLRGTIGNAPVEDGLFVHFSNIENLYDMTTISDSSPRLSVCVFLEGRVEARVRDFVFPMPEFDAQARTWKPVAVTYSQRRTETFTRRADKGIRVKKVIISVSAKWLSDHLQPPDPMFETVHEFLECPLNHAVWTPSPHAIAMAEQIIAAPEDSEFQQRLYIASRAYGILEEAFLQCSGTRNIASTHSNYGVQRKKLQAIEHFLSGLSGHLPTADELAANAGMSVNSLQRLLTTTYGLSTSRFVRRFMLERARIDLEQGHCTIAEAAHVAGYSTPANFSTAFKREFGLSPKKIG